MIFDSILLIQSRFWSMTWVLCSLCCWRSLNHLPQLSGADQSPCVFCALCSLYMSVIAVYMYVVCIIVVLICNVFYWVWVVFLKLCVLCPASDRGLLQADICVSGTGRCSPKRRGTGSVSRGERPPQSLWRRWRAAPRKAPPLWSSRSRATVCFSAASTRRPSPATAKPLWVEHQFVCLQAHLREKMILLTPNLWNLWPWSIKPVLSRWGYICSNSQQYIVGVKILIFLLCQKSLGY